MLLSWLKILNINRNLKENAKRNTENSLCGQHAVIFVYDLHTWKNTGRSRSIFVVTYSWLQNGVFKMMDEYCQFWLDLLKTWNLVVVWLVDYEFLIKIWNGSKMWEQFCWLLGIQFTYAQMRCFLDLGLRFRPRSTMITVFLVLWGFGSESKSLILIRNLKTILLDSR